MDTTTENQQGEHDTERDQQGWGERDGSLQAASSAPGRPGLPGPGAGAGALRLPGRGTPVSWGTRSGV